MRFEIQPLGCVLDALETANGEYRPKLRNRPHEEPRPEPKHWAQTQCAYLWEDGGKVVAAACAGGAVVAFRCVGRGEPGRVVALPRRLLDDLGGYARSGRLVLESGGGRRWDVSLVSKGMTGQRDPKPICTFEEPDADCGRLRLVVADLEAWDAGGECAVPMASLERMAHGLAHVSDSIWYTALRLRTGSDVIACRGEAAGCEAFGAADARRR